MVSDCDEFVRRQRALADFGEFALRCDDLQQILDEACRLIAGALGADLAKVMEIERDRSTGLVCAGFGWRPGIVGHARISLREQTSEAFAIARSEPIITPDITKEDRFGLPSFMHEHGVVAIINVPILLPGGASFGLLEADATEPRSFSCEDIAFLRTYCAVLGPVIDRLKIKDDLSRAAERYRLIVENARDYVIFLTDKDDRITDWLPGAAAILGWSEDEMLGKSASIIFTPEEQQSGVPQQEKDAARANGSSADVRWHMTKAGGRVFLDGQTIVMRDQNGGVRGYLKIAQDVTERKRDEERRTILVAELQHRVRNVLAMVAAVVRRGDAGATTEEFRTTLSGRIAALARTQVVLTQTAGAGVDLRTALSDELSVQVADQARVTILGPTILLASKAAEVLTLAIHELVTNAVKYGALHQTNGRVAVEWKVVPRDGHDWLEFEWRESGVVIDPGPTRRRGFGTELITGRVPYELRGRGEVDLSHDGLVCRIAFPLTPGESILQTDLPVTARITNGR